LVENSKAARQPTPALRPMRATYKNWSQCLPSPTCPSSRQGVWTKIPRLVTLRSAALGVWPGFERDPEGCPALQLQNHTHFAQNGRGLARRALPSWPAFFTIGGNLTLLQPCLAGEHSARAFPRTPKVSRKGCCIAVMVCLGGELVVRRCRCAFGVLLFIS